MTRKLIAIVLAVGAILGALGGDPTPMTPVQTYTVTFNVNGYGALRDSEKIIQLTSSDRFGYTCLAPEPMVPNQAGVGYGEFQGWYTTSAASGGMKLEDGTPVTRNVTYYARWTYYRYVVFDPNGGQLSDSYRYVKNGSSIGALPTPTRDGYTFDGWYTAASGGTKVTSSTIVTATGANITTLLTYYARWKTSPTCTVTFNANGGIFGNYDVTWTKSVTGSSQYGSLPTPARSFYTFVGWYTSASGGTRIYPSSALFSNSSHTLYAHWEEDFTTSISTADARIVETEDGLGNTYYMNPVVLTPGDGTGSPLLTHALRGNASIPANRFTRNGYSFSGWKVYDACRFGETSYSYMGIGGGYAGEYSSGSVFEFCGLTALVAQWRANTYTVTFDLNAYSSLGYQVTESTRTVLKGDCVGELPYYMAPPLAGVGFGQFQGWYTAKTGGTKVTENTIVNGNETYYGHWIYFRYIELNANGGVVDDDVWPYVESGKSLGTLPLPTPTRDGYTFDGWYTATSGGTKVTSSTTVTATSANITTPLTYYAHWNEQEAPPNYPPTDGLVAYYPFDGNANDASGNNNHGIIHGASLSTDRNGRENSAFHFDGINDWIEIMNSDTLMSLTNGMTFTAWVCIDEWDTWVPVFCKSTGDGDPLYDFKYTTVWGNTSFEGLNMQLFSLSTSPKKLVWTHVALSFDGDRAIVYHNGIESGSGTGGSFASTSPYESLALGRDAPGDDEWFNGAMDDVRIYNRALSAAEVKALYDSSADGGTTYTVTYEPGANGSGAQQTASKTHGVALTLKNAIFTRSGYTQTGWATSDGGSKAYDLGASYTANAAITLYPYWIVNNDPPSDDDSPQYGGNPPPYNLEWGWGGDFKFYEEADDADGLNLAAWRGWFMGDWVPFWFGVGVKMAIPIEGLQYTLTEDDVVLVAGSYSDFGNPQVVSDEWMYQKHYTALKNAIGRAPYGTDQGAYGMVFDDDVRGRNYSLSLDIWPNGQTVAGRQWILIEIGGRATQGIKTFYLGLKRENKYLYYGLYACEEQITQNPSTWAQGELAVLPWPIGAGTVTGGGVYRKGNNVTLTASPGSDCEFVGWYDYDEYRWLGTSTTINYTSPGWKTTVYAVFKQSTARTITFDANGGTVSPSTKVVELGEDIGELPVPERIGHTFAGWWTSANGGSPVTESTIVTANDTYYAQWTVNQYTATFDVNGGNGGTTKTQNYGTSLTAPPVTRTGYTPTGWVPTVPATMPASNGTYVAQWRINSYTATFDANGGVGGTTKKQNYNTTLTAPPVFREGHTFAGWSPSVPSKMPAANNRYVAQWTVNQYTATFDANGGVGGTTKTQNYGTSLTAPSVERTGYTLTGWVPTVPAKMPASNGTYVAQWKINTYAVTFDATGGVAEFASLARDYETALGTLPGASWTSYELIGWFTSASGGEPVNEETLVTSNTTFYAHWNQIAPDFTIVDGTLTKAVTGPFSEVVIPDGVKRIGDKAFENCSGLTSVTIPDSVTSIGSSAFEGCSASLYDTTTIPGVKLVDGWAVGYTDSIPESLNLTGIRGVGDDAFFLCSGLTSVTIPEGVMSIGRGSFGWCDGLTSVTIPNSVTSIGDYAFWFCRGLTSVTIPNSVTSIGDYAFNVCSGLTSVTIPEGVMSIGSGSFEWCDGLTSVTILSRSLHVADWTFWNSGKLLKNVYASSELKGTLDKNMFPSSAKISYGTVVQVYVEEGQEDMGTVSGYGAYQPGKNAALKATPKKGYVFVGWRYGGRGATALPGDGAKSLSKSASYSYPVTDEHVVIVASFAKAEDDIASLKVNVASDATASDGMYSLDLGVCVESLSQPKLAVSGLPSGVKYDAKTLKLVGKATKPGVYTVTVKATNASVTRATDATTATFKITVPNFECAALPGLKPETGAYGTIHAGVKFGPGLIDCTPEDGWTVKAAGLPAGLKFAAKETKDATYGIVPAWTIYGVPTAKAGAYTVTFTASKKGEKNQVATITLNVEALPAWAVGNFEGFVSLNENNGGLATMSVAAAGKISGKISYGGTNWTFKADSFAVASETVGYTNLAIRTVATSGKATLDLSLNMVDFLVDSLPSSTTSFAEGYFGEIYTMMYRLPWKDKGDVGAAALVASYAGAYSCTVQYGDETGDVAFVLDEKGAVKGTVMLPDGAKTRKATFSSNALTGDNSLSVVIALPPDAKKGYPAVFKVVNLVNHSGEGADNLAFRDPGVVAAVAELTAESGATGTVSVNPKYGQVAPGKDVTLTAKAAKGSVFHRWEITGVDTEGIDLSSSTLKIKMTDTGDVFAKAVFVTAEEDAASIALSVDALGGEISPEAIISVTNTCGVALKWSVAADALSQSVVAVSGLPSGLKFTAKDIMKKGSKTEIDIPANTIYGAPTAESKLDAKTGLRKPSVVKFTVTTAGKSKRVYSVDMTVLPLPGWAVGTFNGGGNHGQVSLTVAKTGKLSGKYLSEGLTWSLVADSFDSIDESGDMYRATLIGKSGKLVMTNEIGVAGNAIGGYAESVDYIAYHNNWKLEPWKTIGKPFAKSAALEYEDSASVAGVPVPGVLSLKFAASGAVTVKGSFITGINEKTGKKILYSASCTAVLAPYSEPDEIGAFDAVVFVYLPPKAGKFDGYVRCIGVRWTGDGWIKQEVVGTGPKNLRVFRDFSF